MNAQKSYLPFLGVFNRCHALLTSVAKDRIALAHVNVYKTVGITLHDRFFPLSQPFPTPFSELSSSSVDYDKLLQADFVKLRKRFKALAGSKEALEKQSKALQELCGKQRLEMDTLRDNASQSGQSHAQLPSTQGPTHVRNFSFDAGIADLCLGKPSFF